MESDSLFDLDVLTEVISLLKKLNKDDQKRTLQTVATFLDITWQGNNEPSAFDEQPFNSLPTVNNSTFSEERNLSPKDFMHDKSPKTDVERVACLGYFLTHYQNTPHFKTLNISSLNTEAAQPKFSNASVAIDNATRAGLFVPAIKGSKQISAAGEIYVQLLPDREAAKAGIKEIRPKRKPRKIQIKKRTDT